jgi:transposase
MVGSASSSASNPHRHRWVTVDAARVKNRLVRSCPGLGPVRTAALLPIVVTPFRFQSKRGFWAYCGLGIVQRSSSDRVRAAAGEWAQAQVRQTRGLNRQFNHTLKAIFKGAVTA